ncbi:hypothetical protein ACWDR5_19625 [Streptomyces koyangensis]
MLRFNLPKFEAPITGVGRCDASALRPWIKGLPNLDAHRFVAVYRACVAAVNTPDDAYWKSLTVSQQEGLAIFVREVQAEFRRRLRAN